MDLKSKKRMAAKILKMGKSRVILDPSESEKLGDAITKSNIRGLINENIIRTIPLKGISRGRYRLRKQKLKKRGKGEGSKKGAAGARVNKKTRYVQKVRAYRKFIKIKKEKGEITNQTFKKIYLHIKGGEVRSIRHIKEMIKEAGR